MEVLDTTIAVVALRDIAGGLSATVIDGEWVLTSYLDPCCCDCECPEMALSGHCGDASLASNDGSKPKFKLIRDLMLKRSTNYPPILSGRGLPVDITSI